MLEILKRKEMHAPLLIAAMMFVASGCANTHSITVGAVPDDYRTNHPIILTEEDQVLDLPVGALSYRMTNQHRQAIAGFLDNYGQSGPSILTILRPEGSRNSAAAARAAADFSKFARKQGVPEGYVQVLAYRAPADRVAPVRLSYPRLQAVVEQCGRWPEDLLATHENKHYANFGCSYQNNLAAQIANPTDLLGPRKMTPIDAENRDSAIGDYKSRQVSDRFRGLSEIDY